MYLTSSASTAAKELNHKSLSPQNVLTALEEMEFDSFIEPLRETLESHRTMAKAKKTDNNKSVSNDDPELVEIETEPEPEK